MSRVERNREDGEKNNRRAFVLCACASLFISQPLAGGSSRGAGTSAFNPPKEVKPGGPAEPEQKPGFSKPQSVALLTIR